MQRRNAKQAKKQQQQQSEDSDDEACATDFIAAAHDCIKQMTNKKYRNDKGKKQRVREMESPLNPVSESKPKMEKKQASETMNTCESVQAMKPLHLDEASDVCTEERRTIDLDFALSCDELSALTKQHTSSSCSSWDWQQQQIEQHQIEQHQQHQQIEQHQIEQSYSASDLPSELPYSSWTQQQEMGWMQTSMEAQWPAHHAYDMAMSGMDSKVSQHTTSTSASTYDSRISNRTISGYETATTFGTQDGSYASFANDSFNSMNPIADVYASLTALAASNVAASNGAIHELPMEQWSEAGTEEEIDEDEIIHL